MEFDEMKKIWDTKNKEAFYVLDEKALYNRILAKKKTGYHITNASELLLIIVNAGAGLFVLTATLSKQKDNISMYLLSGWMFVSAFYMLISRIRRMKGSQRFDRSMLGDLSHAISMASYQVRLSQVGRWNILPIGLLCLLGLWEGGRPMWSILMIVIFFAFAAYAAKWEHNIYRARKRELESLKNKLTNETTC